MRVLVRGLVLVFIPGTHKIQYGAGAGAGAGAGFHPWVRAGSIVHEDWRVRTRCRYRQVANETPNPQTKENIEPGKKLENI